MEDRYLFRGKRIDTKEWVVGNRVDSPDGRAAISETSGDWKLHECIPSTICQCTGLEDKNGKLIWENDLVKDLFSDTIAPIRYGSYQSCFDSTKTEHVGFYVDWSVTDKKYMRKDLGYWINMVDVKIVGSVIDNPEF